MSVLKSVRIPEDLYDYIQQYRGDGFNQKFSNIIRDARNSEAERLARLKTYDVQIRQKEKVLTSVEAGARDLALKLRLM